MDWDKFLYNDKFYNDQQAFKKWDKQYELLDIIEKDLPRIRSDQEYFNQQQIKLELSQIMYFFTIQNKIKYQQGMLELCVPFLLLREQNIRLSKCYALYSAFMRLNQNLYLQKSVIRKKDNQFVAKIELPYNMASLYFLKILIAYHEPILVDLFTSDDWNMLSVWIMTLFSQKTQMDLVMIIFDLYIKKQNKFFVLFLCASLIISKKDEMIEFYEENPDDFIIYVSNNLQKITFKTEKEIYGWFDDAEKLKQYTPESFDILLEYTEYSEDNMLSQQDINNLLESIKKEQYLIPIYPQEIISFIDGKSKIKNFKLIDCRAQKKLYIQNLFDPKQIQNDENYHYILIINQDQDKQQLRSKIQQIIQTKYIGLLQGGFESLIDKIIQDQINIQIGTIFTKILWFFKQKLNIQ